MKDCCKPTDEKGKFRRIADRLTATIIGLLVLAGLLLAIVRYFKG